LDMLNCFAQYSCEPYPSYWANSCQQLNCHNEVMAYTWAAACVPYSKQYGNCMAGGSDMCVDPNPPKPASSSQKSAGPSVAFSPFLVWAISAVVVIVGIF
jgi:hypothetical protein